MEKKALERGESGGIREKDRGRNVYPQILRHKQGFIYQILLFLGVESWLTAGVCLPFFRLFDDQPGREQNAM